jgi:hypothetical protein
MRTAPGLMRVISGVWRGRMPSSPFSPGSATNLASPLKMLSSALTTSTWMVAICQEEGSRTKQTGVWLGAPAAVHLYGEEGMSAPLRRLLIFLAFSKASSMVPTM